jgi:hypothetical protein
MKTTMPPPFTKEQLRLKMLKHAKMLAEHWATSRIKECEYTVQDRIEGALFSFFVYLDSGAGNSPCAYDLVARPHPEDKSYNIENGNQWVEDGMVINDDCQMHEAFSSTRNK